MKKLTNTETLKVLADAVKNLQDEVNSLQKELRLVKNKLKKYDNKTIGGFNSYLSPRNMGTDNDTEY